MNPRSRLLAALGLVLAGGPAAYAADRGPSALRRGVEARQLVPLAEIIGRLLPQMPGSTYIGAEFEPAVPRYRLKFLRGRQVIWVDVDARTGRVLGRFSP